MNESELKSELEAKAGASDIEAIYELGWRSALGIGLPHNEAAGLNWLRQAAARGHMLAQNNLGARYLAGDGVPQDAIEAYRWFTLAAAQGDRKAGKNRDSVAASLTPEQLSKLL
jgi:TPR repeat protein